MRKPYTSPEQRTTIPEYITYSLAICGTVLYTKTKKIISFPGKTLDRIITKMVNEIGGTEDFDIEDLDEY